MAIYCRIPVFLLFEGRLSMSNFRILTNNPSVAGAYSAIAQPIDGGVSQVFNAVRDAVHLGAELISHPLSGSLKPNESPFKSVLLSTARGSVHRASLTVIEDAASVFERLPIKARLYSTQVMADFECVDLDLTRQAIRALPAGFYTYPETEGGADRHDI